MSARRYHRDSAGRFDTHAGPPSPARARAIRQAREWAQMSQQDLARTLGVARWVVRCWEAAVRDPGPGHGGADRCGYEGSCLVAADAVT